MMAFDKRDQPDCQLFDLERTDLPKRMQEQETPRRCRSGRYLLYDQRQVLVGVTDSDVTCNANL